WTDRPRPRLRHHEGPGGPPRPTRHADDPVEIRALGISFRHACREKTQPQSRHCSTESSPTLRLHPAVAHARCEPGQTRWVPAGLRTKPRPDNSSLSSGVGSTLMREPRTGSSRLTVAQLP